LSIVANIGGETNPDRESNGNPLFLIGGLVCSGGEDFDIDCGVEFCEHTRVHL